MTIDDLVRRLVGELRANTALCKAVGSRMRSERVAVGLTLAGAAGQMGVSQPYLSMVEKGERAPSLVMLDKAAAWRGRSLAWMLVGADAPEAAPGRGKGGGGRTDEPRMAIRLPVVGGGGVQELPGEMMVYVVPDDALEPAWHRGQRLAVVRAGQDEQGPAILRERGLAWRIVGVIF